MAEAALLIAFYIQLQASNRISIRTQFVYDGWVYF